MASEFVARQGRHVGDAVEDFAKVIGIAAAGAGFHVVAHFPGAELRGEGQRDNLIERGFRFDGRLGGQIGEVVRDLGLNRFHVLDYRQKRLGFNKIDAEGAGGFKVATVVADQMTGLCFHSQMHECFVVRIIQDGLPSVRKPAAFSQRAEGVKQSVNLLQGQVEGAGLALDDFLVFGEHGLAEDQGPSSRPEGFENLIGCAPFGPKSGVENVGVHDGAGGHVVWKPVFGSGCLRFRWRRLRFRFFLALGGAFDVAGGWPSEAVESRHGLMVHG